MLLKLFPTLVCVIDDLLNLDYVEHLKPRTDKLESLFPRGGHGWQTEVYNSIDVYDLNKDKEFDGLTNKVTEVVNEFGKEFGIQDKLFSSLSWFNCYYEKDYQEFHIHPNSIFSAVYFLKAPNGSSNLVFQNPCTSFKMFIAPQINYNENSTDLWNIPANENRLVIFPSYIQHMVPAHKSKDKRTSIAFNFRCNL